MMKICRKCSVEQEIENFHKDVTAQSGRKSVCRFCVLADCKKRRKADPERFKANKKRAIEKNPERARQLQHASYERNRDKRIAQYKIYYVENRERILSNQRARNEHKRRRQIDVPFKLAGNLRNRLNDIIKKNSRKGSAVRDLGCSVEYLKSHLESKFQPGMTWDNWGKGIDKWQIDHIIPLSAFDLTDRQHFLLACNYLNLQPLWHRDNMRKGSRIIL